MLGEEFMEISIRSVCQRVRRVAFCTAGYARADWKQEQEQTSYRL